jgi:hypothetical protein
MEDISFVFQKIAVDDLIGSTHFLDDWSGPVAGPASGPGRGD